MPTYKSNDYKLTADSRSSMMRAKSSKNISLDLLSRELLYFRFIL